MDKMKNYRQLLKELPANKVVFTFGRFQPATVGHELLFKVVKKVASVQKADYVVYVSRTQDKKKNPLSVDRKIHYLNLMFKDTNFVPANADVRTPIEVAKWLNKKYKNLVMIVGSDQQATFTKLLNTYNGKEYHYDTIEVISAGERDPDADDAPGMSGTKMRAAAVKGDFVLFKKGLPNTLRDIDGKLLMNEIRVGMGLEAIKEQIKFDVNTIREQFFRKEIFNIGDLVESSGVQYEILDRGSNYLTVVDSEGNTSKKWIQECTQVQVAVVEDIQPGYAPEEITFKGYTTKNFHHTADAAKAFQSTIERYGSRDPVAVLNAIKSTDAYMGLNDVHLEQGKTPDVNDLKTWREAHNKARESLQRTGEFQHHVDYWNAHEAELQNMETEYNPTSAGADMNEELTTKTIKPNDKLKVARIIASFLSVDNPEALSSPEQIVNMGLRKVRSKALNAESIAILHKMLGLADEVGIQYDSKLIPTKLKESIDSRVTIDPKSGYNAAKDVMRYKDFKKLMKVNKGEIPEGKKPMEQDDDDMDPTDYDDKVAGEPDEKGPDTGETVPAVKLAYRDLENKGPIASEVGSGLGHGTNSQLRRRKVAYSTQSESVEEASFYPAGIDKLAPAERKKVHDDLMKRRSDYTKNAWKAQAEFNLDQKRKNNEEVELEEGIHHKKMMDFAKDTIAKMKPGETHYVGRYSYNPGVEHAKETHAKMNAKGKVNFYHKDGIKGPLISAKKFDKPDKAIDEMAMDSINHPVHGKVEWRNDSGAHTITTKAKSGATVIHAMGDHKTIAGKWSKLKAKLQTEELEEAKKSKKKATPVTDDSRQIGSAGNQGFDAFFEEDEHEDVEISDHELDAMADSVKDVEDVIDAYDDHELAIINDEGEEMDRDIKEDVLLEVLSRMERLRAKVRFAKSSSTRHRHAMIALKSRSSSTTINKRARKLAINLIKLKIAKKPLNTLSVGEKERIEKIIQRKKALVNRLAMKLTSKVRKIENDRLSHHKYTK